MSSSSSSYEDDNDKKTSYKEDKEARMERTNQFKKDKKEMKNVEPFMEKLKQEVSAFATKIEMSANEGWTVLGEYRFHNLRTSICICVISCKSISHTFLLLLLPC